MFGSNSSEQFDSGPTLLRARWVLPLVREPIENGAILIQEGRIQQVGPWPELQRQSRARLEDLGEVILLPGLVNAHCHLDYTGMAGQITPLKSFSDWIKALLALKAHWTYTDYAASWLAGARMLLHHGVTTVADIEAVPELLPEVRLATPLRVCSFVEMTGVRSRRAPAQIIAEAIEHIAAVPTAARWAGLSPHAPYSTTPELLRQSAAAARQRGWLITTHLSESAEEFEMFLRARGPMYDWLQSQRDPSDCGLGSPTGALERAGLLAENFIAVHVNYLAPGDASLLGERGCGVVHCPRSHAYFRHEPFPWKELEEAGVNICVGTDSLVSTVVPTGERLELNLLAELRAMQRAHPGLSPERLLRFITLQGAKALRRAGELGELSPGALADLIAIAGRSTAGDVYETVIAHPGPVARVMINGQWVHSSDLPPETSAG